MNDTAANQEGEIRTDFAEAFGLPCDDKRVNSLRCRVTITNSALHFLPERTASAADVTKEIPPEIKAALWITALALGFAFVPGMTVNYLWHRLTHSQPPEPKFLQEPFRLGFERVRGFQTWRPRLSAMPWILLSNSRFSNAIHYRLRASEGAQAPGPFSPPSDLELEHFSALESAWRRFHGLDESAPLGLPPETTGVLRL
jgi:hypothetical protein